MLFTRQSDVQDFQNFMFGLMQIIMPCINVCTELPYEHILFYSRRAMARFWIGIMKVPGPTKTEVVLITIWGGGQVQIYCPPPLIDIDFFQTLLVERWTIVL